MVHEQAQCVDASAKKSIRKSVQAQATRQDMSNDGGKLIPR
jgi:hypothetical protein